MHGSLHGRLARAEPHPGGQGEQMQALGVLKIMDDHPSNWKCPWCREGLQTWLGEAMADCYCPPPDAVGNEDIRRLASEALRRVPLPSDLEQLARSILRHIPTD